jgi:hypothetical protein
MHKPGRIIDSDEDDLAVTDYRARAKLDLANWIAKTDFDNFKLECASSPAIGMNIPIRSQTYIWDLQGNGWYEHEYNNKRPKFNNWPKS